MPIIVISDSRVIYSETENINDFEGALAIIESPQIIDQNTIESIRRIKVSGRRINDIKNEVYKCLYHYNNSLEEPNQISYTRIFMITLLTGLTTGLLSNVLVTNDKSETKSISFNWFTSWFTLKK